MPDRTPEKTTENNGASLLVGRKGNIYLGNPCKRGHVGWRYVGNRTCIECCKEAASERFWDPAYQRWRYQQCKMKPGFLLKKNAGWRAWREINAELYRSKKREWRKNNPQKTDAYRKRTNAKWWNTLKLIYPESTR